MKKYLVLAGMLSTAFFSRGQSVLPVQTDILQSLRQANAYFMHKWPDPGQPIVTNTTRPSHIWTRSVYYEGLMALYAIDPRVAYYNYALAWGADHHWTPRNGQGDRNADDQCCGQTFLDLYQIDPRPERAAGIKACIDSMIPGDRCDDWHWIDALQMAMPVFTRLGVLYKDSAYFRKMYDLYHYTRAALYNPTDHLWWRDKDFKPPYKEPNGADCYWSQGNGWVLAALVRVLSLLPVDDPHRPEYLQDYLDMAAALAPLQRPDGFWNVSLHDSTHFGGKELSGTALFTYGLAWGIRQGYLDKKVYLPVVTRAWNGISQDVLHNDGMLGYVQGTGKEPKDGQPVTYDKIPDFEDYGLGCFLLAGAEVYQLAPPPAANLDESKVLPYVEPDPLKMTDGRLVHTASGWKNVQRPYIYHLFEKYVYGRMPAGSIAVRCVVRSVDSTALDGQAIRRDLTLYFSPTAHLDVVLFLPRNARHPSPVFVSYNFSGNATVKESPQWPLRELIAHGYGLASAWYQDLEPDRADGWQTGIRTTLASALDIQPYEWSAIGAWAWGLEQMADYLKADPSIDPHGLIVLGHSRLGKAAVWAGASDPSFAAVVSNESGEGGAALSKRNYGETIAIITNHFPYWFSPAYKQFAACTDSLPFDQHMLLSLVAPRPLYVASAEGDQWSDPRGEFLSAHLAAGVYGLFKEKGLGADHMPPVETPVGDVVHYHIRTGKHDITLYDWTRYMEFCDKFVRGNR